MNAKIIKEINDLLDVLNNNIETSDREEILPTMYTPYIKQKIIQIKTLIESENN